MKDCKTFLKLQEAAVNKQAEAKRKGYEGNTSNAPTMIQQANNGASQGQTSQAKEITMTEDISRPKGTSQ
jgi:hypothetical protein